MEDGPKVERSLSRRDVVLFLVCTLVGLDTLGSVAAHGGEGFVWLLVMAATFFVPYALTVAELGAAFPQEGGAYVWTKLAFGRSVAALNAVFYWISNPIWLGGALTITAITTFETFFVPLGLVGKCVFGLALVWGSVASAVVSLRVGAWITRCGAVARVALLVLFTGTVAIYAARHGVHGARLPQFSPTYDGFFAVVPLLFFNFVGFELPSAAGGEMVDPRRDVPFAVARAAIAAVVCYGVPILAILLVLPTERITGLKGFVDTMQLVFTVYGGHVQPAAGGGEIVVLEGAGRVMGAVAAIGFIVALATSGITWIMGADRSQAVACLDGGGPRWLGSFENRWGTPVALNVASGIVATLVMLAAFAVTGGDSEKFFAASLNLGISTTTLSYLVIFPTLFLLRRKSRDVARPYRVPGGDVGAFVASVLTTGWACFAAIGLLWPGFGRRGDPDAALPSGFVTLDAHGMVVASERALFELTQIVPLVIFLALGVLLLARGRRERALKERPVSAPARASSLRPSRRSSEGCISVRPARLSVP